MKLPKPFFILGGGSQDVLDKITTLKEHEQRRISNLGMLLLIPVLFAGIGMFYTLSIYTDNYAVMIIGSLIWCYVIFVIDSSFIDNLRKSRHHKTGFWYYIGILLRISMACLIGYLISHQLLFYIFKDNIDAKILQISEQEKSAQVDKSRAKLENAKADVDKKIQTLDNKISCYENLISLEQSYKGDEFKEVSYNGIVCGYASGKGASCQDRCESYKTEKERLITQRNNLEQQKLKDTANLSQILARDEQVLKENKPTDDLLQKDVALNILRQENKAINQMYWALLLLFMIIDTLIVITKLTSPMGMYEHTMDAMIEENKAILKAEEAGHILYAKTVAEEEALIIAKHLGIAKSVSALANVPLKISQDIRDVITQFGEHLKESRTVSNKKISENTKVKVSEKYEDLYLKLIDKAFKEIEKE